MHPYPSPHICTPPPSAPSISPLFSLHRLLSATAPTSPNPFAVEDCLVATCGLTRAQAIKASKKIDHLKSPARPDAVLAFLSAQGLSRADIATIVTKDPKFLCTDVEKNLSKRVAELGELGLSRAQIARLIPLARTSFRTSSIAPNLAFWLPVLRSFDNVVKAVHSNNDLLSIDLDKGVKPNLALLQRCGIDVSDFPGAMARVLTRPPRHLEETMVRINEFGIKPISWAFRHVLEIFGVLSHEYVTRNIELLEKLGWSRDDVLLALRKMPRLLSLSEERIRRSMEFLTKDVGLAVPYIAQRPALLMFSIDCRLFPRHCLINDLKAKGFLNYEYSFITIAAMSKERCLHQFVLPYEERVPGLLNAYVSSCAGKHQ